MFYAFLPPHPSSLSGSSCCQEVSLPGLGSRLQVTHNCLTFTFLCLGFLINKIEMIMVPSTRFKGLSSNANKTPRTHAWHIGVALEMQAALSSPTVLLGRWESTMSSRPGAAVTRGLRLFLAAHGDSYTA